MSIVKFLIGALAALLPFALLGAVSLVSCDLASDLSKAHRLRVALPESPPSWAFLPDLRMALSWRAPGGAIRSMAASPGEVVEIEVERGRPQEIIVLPSSAGRGLGPAGALYPEAAEAARHDAIALDWIGGYVASVALALEGAGIDAREYDLERLSREAVSRSSDPWVLPASETARRLAEGSFRATAFDEPERFKVALPGEGPWASESPFAAAPVPSSAGVYEVELPTGLWRFVGVERELLVSVDESGASDWVLRPSRDLP